MAIYMMEPWYKKPSGGGIYGAEWDGSSTTQWTRTDDAVGLSNPNPYYEGMSGNPSSPFDNILPWSGMVVSEDSEAGTVVAIPKFYFKLSYANPESATKGLKIQISRTQHTGFQCSPAHMDRGDGVGERSVIYVGKYHCASGTTDKYKSKTGVLPLVSETRSAFRSGIHDLGSNIWQWDYATLLTIQMLYLVEFADWNSQAMIGYGCSGSGSRQNTGLTDSMQYHTGISANSRTTYGHTQYRNIEDLWGNVFDWIGGIRFDSSNNVYVIKNPSQFSDTANGVNVGTRPNSDGFIMSMAISSVSDYTWFFYPKTVSTQYMSTSYICDKTYKGGVNLRVGGSEYQDFSRGLFYSDGGGSESSTGLNIGSRLMKL